MKEIKEPTDESKLQKLQNHLKWIILIKFLKKRTFSQNHCIFTDTRYTSDMKFEIEYIVRGTALICVIGDMR